jgi:hypothetical protein
VKNPGHMPARSEVADDTPLRLAVAAALAYPDGSMSASGLRREAARGRLVIERTAGKDYTTLAEIDRMRELCRQPPGDHAFCSDGPGGMPRGPSPTRPSGSLRTMADTGKALAAALTIVEGLSSCSSNTSLASGSKRRRAPVIPIKSQ